MTEEYLSNLYRKVRGLRAAHIAVLSQDYNRLFAIKNRLNNRQVTFANSCFDKNFIIYLRIVYRMFAINYLAYNTEDAET